MLFVDLFFRLCCFSVILFSYDGNPCSRKKLIHRQVESVWDSTQKRMRVRSSCVSLQICLVNKCYPYSIANIYFIQEVWHQTFMCQCLYTLASLTLQGCRAWLLRRNQFCSYIPCGPYEDCLAFMLHSIFSGQYSLELLRLSRELLSGDSGHVGDWGTCLEPTWAWVQKTQGES